MDYHQEQSVDFNNVVETLMTMFGNVISRDVVFAVVENCGGDLNLAAEAIVNISSDTGQNFSEQQQQQSTNIMNPPINSSQYTDTKPPQDINLGQNQPVQPPMSYSSAFRSTGALPKQTKRQIQPPPSMTLWTDQIRQIISQHNHSSRILILMRGAPGSGKTYLARQIVEMTVGGAPSSVKKHILSTDDFFMVGNNYQFDKNRLSEAHHWNQQRARFALAQGESPIIIDNTNIEIWEMEPYLKDGVRNGYIIEIVEPNTPWAKKPYQLVKRNVHDVPLANIRRMVDNYQEGVTGHTLIKCYGLSYPAGSVPPVMRNFPPVVTSDIQANVSENNTSYVQPNYSPVQVPAAYKPNQVIPLQDDIKSSTSPSIQNCIVNKNDETLIKAEATSNYDGSEEPEQEIRQKKYLEIQKQLDEIQKVELEWENGEKWNEKVQETVSSSKCPAISFEPKPPREHNFDESSSSKAMLETVRNIQDWRQISMFMPSWSDNNNAQSQPNNPFKIPVQKVSVSTSVDLGDTNLKEPNNWQKIVSTKSRDINIHFDPSVTREKIPEKRMLDKSTMTNEHLMTESVRCKNEEQHFIAFRKMFNYVPKTFLRDIFDNCCGDVNWAVEIVLEGMANNEFKTMDVQDISDSEEEIQEQCDCLAAYHIIPDKVSPSSNSTVTTYSKHNITEPLPELVQKMPTSNVVGQEDTLRKAKVSPSDVSLELKRQIERHFVIPDKHYSPHTLKIRKMRHCEDLLEKMTAYIQSPAEMPANDDLSNAAGIDLRDSISETIPTEMKKEKNESNPGTVCDSPTNKMKNCINPFVKEASVDAKPSGSCNQNTESDDEDSIASGWAETERTVNVNLGKEFIQQLDALFGRSGMTYPNYIEFFAKMPVTLLNEMNALWMESFMHQLDEKDKNNSQMIKEDEEFARQLASKEAELAQLGKEPEVPDFKEIMDMDFALSLYQKDIDEWRNKEPTDMAAKMTRDKLYNLFPDMSHDILSEMLMAHDNNFQATVEVLLLSTGKGHILDMTNGLNKFVMEKEIQRQEKLLELEKKALCEVEWPLLPKGDKVEMYVVEKYREEADNHLLRRNLNYQKAQEYIRRGMTQVASYYSEVAAFHKQKYEQANSMAAASLIQVHASNVPDNATIDLHYLRVREAKESLDLFIDTHIQKLKENQNSGVRFHTLFFITGRGLHSNGRPRIKPAVRKRLIERGLIVSERNPGLLTARVCADDKLSHQVQAP